MLYYSIVNQDYQNKRKEIAMNGETIFNMLSKMTSDERKQVEVCLFSSKLFNDNLAHEEALYLSSEIENLEVSNAQEVAFNIKPYEFAKMQDNAYYNTMAFEYSELASELINNYLNDLRIQIKNKMIEELKKIGYEIPSGI